jgi:predicted 3-demethylubiquinone-9 3-methyltransferase (glyoxalase superfamily)
MQSVSTCLWFDDQAQEARLYEPFPNSRIIDTKYYLEGSPPPRGDPCSFSSRSMALSSGAKRWPAFRSPAVSLWPTAHTQEDADTLWHKLSEGGQESQCGWLTDKYGVSWQIVPRALPAVEHIRYRGITARLLRDDE